MKADTEFPSIFFWDADLSKLDLEKNKDAIIERILELGDEKAVRWLFSAYSLIEIKSIAKESRGLSAKSRNFWRIILGS